jgi:hypothetical protein
VDRVAGHVMYVPSHVEHMNPNDGNQS